MNNFEIELRQWLDQDGLVGSQKNPPKWSTGNPLLETAIARLLYMQSGEARLILELEQAASKCWYDGALHKNPGRNDQITHDDIIGFASMNAMFATRVCNAGLQNGWYLGNTNEEYFEGYAKPWHVAFYLASSGYFECGPYEAIIFWFNALLASFMADYSGIRLWYLMVNTRPPRFEWLFKPVWIFLFKRRFGSFKTVQQEYYGSKDHVLVEYA